MACRPESSSCWAVRRTAIATECRSWRAKGPLTGAPFCAPRHQPPHTIQLTASRTSAPVLSGALRPFPGLSGAVRGVPERSGRRRCTPVHSRDSRPGVAGALRCGPVRSGALRTAPRRSGAFRGVPVFSAPLRCAPVLFSREPPPPRNRAQFRLIRTVSAIACAPNRRRSLPNFADGFPSISGNSVRAFRKRRPPSRSATPVTPPRPLPSRPPVIDPFFHPTRKPAVPTGHESPWETSVTGGQWHRPRRDTRRGTEPRKGYTGRRSTARRTVWRARDTTPTGEEDCPDMTGRSPFAGETSKSGRRDVKVGVPPKPTPRGEETGMTSTCRAAGRTDRAARLAHAEPPCASPPRPLSSPSPKIQLRPPSRSLDSRCLTTSVRRSTPPSRLPTGRAHPLPRFTRPAEFPLFAEFPPSIRGPPVPDFRKRRPSLTPYHDFPSLPFSIGRPPKLRLPPPPLRPPPVLFPETPIIFSRPPFLGP